MTASRDIPTDADGLTVSSDNRLVDLEQFIQQISNLRAAPDRHSRSIDGEITALRLKRRVRFQILHVMHPYRKSARGLTPALVVVSGTLHHDSDVIGACYARD